MNNGQSYEQQRADYQWQSSIVDDQRRKEQADYIAQQQAKLAASKGNSAKEAHYRTKLENLGASPEPSSSSSCTVS
jgi:hypothetical protein